MMRIMHTMIIITITIMTMITRVTLSWILVAMRL